MGNNDRENKEISEGVGESQMKEESIGDLSEENLYAKVKSLEEELEEKKREYNELYDRHLRMAADFDNYKKRVTKEKADIIAYGNEELIKALLNVLDNLERAIEHSESIKEAEPIVEGVKLVHKQFLSCLEKFGVKTIEAKQGQPFDPRYHQAIEYVESDDIAPGVIVSEMLKGYMLKDRLLRPALVVVSKEKKEAQPEAKSSVEGDSKGDDTLEGDILELVEEEE
ncbi:MAG: nucleotide exchange factor GrpE [Deltaproteobacteria bacterium]|nr:MAG: nucleotide exchange factor GrpE [Deltaproteobacteria bacterium]